LKSYLQSIIRDKLIEPTKSQTVKEFKVAQINFTDGFSAEGYELEVNEHGVFISASTSTGAFYGIQSLKTLIPASVYIHPQKEIQIPFVGIKDEPRFAYRAFMLDVGRNFQPKS